MTPHEFDQYEKAFTEAATKLGWRRHVYEESHERDDCSWIIRGWLDARGRWVIGDNDLTEAMAEEIIRLVALLPVAPSFIGAVP